MKKAKRTYGHYFITDNVRDVHNSTVYKVGRFAIPNGETLERKGTVRLRLYQYQCDINLPIEKQRDPELYDIRNSLVMVVVGETLSLNDAKAYENHMMERHQNPKLLNKNHNRKCSKYAGAVRTMETVLLLKPKRKCAA